MGDIPRQLKHVFSPTSLAAHLAKFTPLWSSLAASDILWWMKVNIKQEHKLRYTLPRASIFYVYPDMTDPGRWPSWKTRTWSLPSRRKRTRNAEEKKSSDDQRSVTKGFWECLKFSNRCCFFLNGFLGVQNLVNSKKTDVLLRLDSCETRWNDCWSHSTLTCFVPFGRWVWDL